MALTSSCSRARDKQRHQLTTWEGWGYESVFVHPFLCEDVIIAQEIYQELGRIQCRFDSANPAASMHLVAPTDRGPRPKTSMPCDRNATTSGQPHRGRRKGHKPQHGTGLWGQDPYYDIATFLTQEWSTSGLRPTADRVTSGTDSQRPCDCDLPSHGPLTHGKHLIERRRD